ncbi:hypothetical protein KMW28_00705 [Flammeovirga yaeyamensis]|uniref:Uncharacterized protein n=1 Tax=Flammeovirga yaeyamensis TaxID=367791 RepID=A0AAX1N3V7_9BACT|nr:MULTISPECIES: hypothetical protein [Flammeovirga]ANQ50441.1 hypothetical protein MY04_3073 [Flammeovirga sp. MY04]MBB3699601.1 hypothetical protein [Flammeovirga yaeyamensis]NMF36826.1 hypothetical protein [Flammeovirga yaeyamensis]QWG02134.1 hypothetical protein KMW28_00705 [Flammeovirga yaeyamensis]
MKPKAFFTAFLLLIGSVLFAQTDEIKKLNSEEYSPEEYSILEMLGPEYTVNLEATISELDWGLGAQMENEALKDEVTKVSEVYVYSAEDFRLVHYHNGDVHNVDLDQISKKADLIMSSEGTYYYVLRD